MAQKVQTLYVDDLDGSEADGTIRFGLDGTEYEIDLNAKHTRELRDILARYVAAGRRVRASISQSSRSGRKAQPDALNTTGIRDWAKAQGIEVKDRGRIPAELVAKFKAAMAPLPRNPDGSWRHPGLKLVHAHAERSASAACILMRLIAYSLSC